MSNQDCLNIPTFKVLPFISGTQFDYDATQEKYLCIIKIKDDSTLVMPADDVEAAHTKALNVLKEMAHKNGWLSDGACEAKNQFAALSHLIDEAQKIGAEACKDIDDMVGTMNLDRLMLCGLSGVREKTLQNAGISCDKKNGCSGTFWLNMSFGSANKNTTGLEAARKYLRENGVDCYIHYQMD